MNFIYRINSQTIHLQSSFWSHWCRLLRHILYRDCRDGNVRIHGPIPQCCPGSDLPPAVVPTTLTSVSRQGASTSTNADSSVHSPTPQHTQTDDSVLNPGLINCRILKRIPRGSGASCAQKLATILDDIVKDNCESAWD